VYHPKTRWLAPTVDEGVSQQLADKLGLNPIVARMLVRRGISDSEEAKRFLNPDLSDLYDPFLLDGMKEAVNRIRLALQKGEKILVYGDYDADGVSSTSLLVRLFRHLGANVGYYIPNRFREGYGIHQESLQRAKEDGVHLVVSVDTGITAVKEAEAAREWGLDLIITDHHEPQETLPNAVAVINPKKPGCSYPFKMLAGVGVAFKLATALLGRLPEEWLDLVALGTIADLVPLVGENRILAYHGLKRMNEKKNPGIRSLLEVAGIDQEVGAGHVGFALGPRINASGRLDSADTAVKLLITPDMNEAEMLAKELDEMNRERQALVESMTEEAVEEVEKEPDKHRHAIVVAKPGWNVGVVGIVASRLVEKYYRPVLVLGIDEEKGVAKGSARSISGFHLFQALSECKEWMTHFGGHAMAAGLSLKVENLPQLHEKLSRMVKERLKPEDAVPLTQAEVELTLNQVEPSLIDQLKMLEPYGYGNPTPLFILREAEIQRVQLIGQNQHIRVRLKKGSHSLDAVGFRMGKIAPELSPFAKAHLVGELTMNEWNGKRTPQMFIRDLAIPHLQVYDWRSNRKERNWLESFDPEWSVFICAKDSAFPLQDRVKCCFWEEAEKGDWVEIAQQAKHIVLIDPPPSMELFRLGLSHFAGAERIYFLFGDRSFDDMLLKTPSRDDFKRLYRVLVGKEKISLDKHLPSLIRVTGLQKRTLSFMIQVFGELGFLKVEHGEITMDPQPPKRPLTESQLYQRQLAREKVMETLVYSSYKDLIHILFSTISFKHVGGYEDGLQRQNSGHTRFSATGDSV